MSSTGKSRNQIFSWGIAFSLVIGAGLVYALASSLARAEPSDGHEEAGQGEQAAATGKTALPGPEEISVPPPPFSEGIFPCTGCHDGSYDKTRRELSVHDDIKFEHDAEHRWCLDCHDAQNRDKLKLASGELVDFTQSYKLCGQCHGDKYRDWRAGVHGKRTGYWDGKKQYLLCVNCHSPHSPHFKPIKPEPTPIRPGRQP